MESVLWNRVQDEYYYWLHHAISVGSHGKWHDSHDTQRKDICSIGLIFSVQISIKIFRLSDHF